MHNKVGDSIAGFSFKGDGSLCQALGIGIFTAAAIPRRMRTTNRRASWDNRDRNKIARQKNVCLFTIAHFD
jgi:hypothetical protein